MIFIYSSSKMYWSTHCLPGPVLRDGHNKISKSQLLQRLCFSRERETENPHKNEWSRARGQDSNGGWVTGWQKRAFLSDPDTLEKPEYGAWALWVSRKGTMEEALWLEQCSRKSREVDEAAAARRKWQVLWQEIQNAGPHHIWTRGPGEACWILV